MEPLPRIEPLNAFNWEKWKNEVKFLLMHYGSWIYVDPESAFLEASGKTPAVAEGSDKSGATPRESFKVNLRKDRANAIIYQSV